MLCNEMLIELSFTSNSGYEGREFFDIKSLDSCMPIPVYTYDPVSAEMILAGVLIKPIIEVSSKTRIISLHCEDVQVMAGMNGVLSKWARNAEISDAIDNNIP